MKISHFLDLILYGSCFSWGNGIGIVATGNPLGLFGVVGGMIGTICVIMLMTSNKIKEISEVEL